VKESKLQTEVTVVKRKCSLCGYELKEAHTVQYGWVQFEFAAEADHLSPSDCIAKLASNVRVAMRAIERIEKGECKEYVKKGDIIPMSCDKHKWWWQR